LMSARFIPVLEKYFNNSLSNIGNKDSFTWYGPRWAQAATAPARMYKAHVSEGGIKCPAIVRYPAGFKPESAGGRRFSPAFATVMDVLPTVLDLAGVPHPGTTFRDRTVLKPRGRTWAPYLSGKVPEIHASTAIHGWELFGQQAIRCG